MRIKAGIKCSLLVAILPPTCESNDTHVVTKRGAKTATIHPYPAAHIEQNDLGFEVLCRKETRGTVISNAGTTSQIPGNHNGCISLLGHHRFTVKSKV